MNRKTLLRIAAGLTLFTFVGHSSTLILPPPQDQVEVVSVYKLMQQTQEVMPMGAIKSIAQIMWGANACTSVLLLLAGLLYISFASEPAGANRKQLSLVNLSMLATCAISLLCFFPLPALCTGLAGILGFVSMKAKS